MEENFSDFTFSCDHFGVFATEDDYQKLKDEIGKKGEIYHEFFRKDKKWMTAGLNNETYEIYGPVTEELTKKTFLNHISFIVNDLAKISKLLEGQIISSFDVKNSHGIKIKPQDMIIEIRNNHIIDSIEDFKN